MASDQRLYINEAMSGNNTNHKTSFPPKTYLPDLTADLTVRTDWSINELNSRVNE